MTSTNLQDTNTINGICHDRPLTHDSSARMSQSHSDYTLLGNISSNWRGCASFLFWLDFKPRAKMKIARDLLFYPNPLHPHQLTRSKPSKSNLFSKIGRQATDSFILNKPKNPVPKHTRNPDSIQENSTTDLTSVFNSQAHSFNTSHNQLHNLTQNHHPSNNFLTAAGTTSFTPKDPSMYNSNASILSKPVTSESRNLFNIEEQVSFKPYLSSEHIRNHLVAGAFVAYSYSGAEISYPSKPFLRLIPCSQNRSLSKTLQGHTG